MEAFRWLVGVSRPVEGDLREGLSSGGLITGAGAAVGITEAIVSAGVSRSEAPWLPREPREELTTI